MRSTLPTRRAVMQQGWVVNDLEAAAHRWSRALGIGPFFVGEFPPEVFGGLRYRGGAGELTMRTAIAFSGDQQIELIQPLGDAPNAYRDMFPAGREGFHHVCFWSDDMDADLAHYARQGAATVNVGVMAGGPRFAYVDTRAQLGCMTELLEPHPMVVGLFARWQASAAAWDGRGPLLR